MTFGDPATAISSRPRPVAQRRFVPNASIYDLQPIVLLDQFPWVERESVLQALARERCPPHAVIRGLVIRT